MQQIQQTINTPSWQIMKDFTYLYTPLNVFAKPAAFPEYKGVNTFEFQLVGSRLSGKTRQVIKFALSALYNNVKTMVVIWRKTPNSATETFDELVGIFENDFNQESDRNNTNVSKRRIKTNGNTVQVKGLENGRKKGVKKLGTARGTKTILINIFEEANEFEQKDIELMKQATGDAEMIINIFIANPWVLSNWYIRNINKNLPFNEEILRAMGQQSKIERQDNIVRIYHISNHRINTHLTNAGHQMLIDTWKIDENLAKVVDLGMPGVAYGSVYGSTLDKIKYITQQQAMSWRYEEISSGIDLGVREHATTWQMVGTRAGDYADVHFDEIYHREDIHGEMTNTAFAVKVCQRLKEWSEKFPHIKAYGHTIYLEHDKSFKEILTTILQQFNLDWVDLQFARKYEERERISLRKYKLQTGRVFIVKENIKMLPEEMGQQLWSDTTKYADGTYKPEDADNHTTDAADYAVCNRMSWITNEDTFRIMHKF